MRPLRLGLIGAGRWAKAYLKTAAGMPDVCRIEAVARRSAQPLESPFAAIRVHAGWHPLLDESLDGWIIATPPDAHSEPACAALRIGIPVMIEKPLTLDVESARKIADSARNIPVLVDHTQTFHPGFAQLRSMVAGKCVIIETISGAWGVFRRDYSSLWDWGAHDVAMTLQITGQMPTRIQAVCEEQRHTAEGIGERFRLELSFPNGSRAVLCFGNILPEKTRRFLVTHEDTRVLYDDWAPPSLFRANHAYAVHQSPTGADSHCVPMNCTPELPLGLALREFCRRVRESDVSRDSLQLGVDTVQVLAEAQAIIARTRPV